MTHQRTDFQIALRLLAAAERPVLAPGGQFHEMEDICPRQLATTLGHLRREGLIRTYRSTNWGDIDGFQEIDALTPLGAQALAAVRPSRASATD